MSLDNRSYNMMAICEDMLQEIEMQITQTPWDEKPKKEQKMENVTLFLQYKINNLKAKDQEHK